MSKDALMPVDELLMRLSVARQWTANGRRFAVAPEVKRRMSEATEAYLANGSLKVVGDELQRIEEEATNA